MYILETCIDDVNITNIFVCAFLQWRKVFKIEIVIYVSGGKIRYTKVWAIA